MTFVVADVKGRSYDASRRQERARANHRAMLDAAVELLVTQGYAGTTLALVAERAGLAAPTAYKAFGNKPAMVKAAFDYAVAGDDEPVPIHQRERAARIKAEPDPVRKLEIYADGLLGTLTRTGLLQLVARAAAEIHPDMQPVWEQITASRLFGMGILATNLSAGGHLRPGVAKEEAQDVLWAYTSPELYQLLVLIRGWPGPRYQEWVVRSLVDALLRARD
ncbi:MAG: TetR/AcrR family transcriptional regulator [Candidatus Dormibacteria bacterium]